jgi:Uncharacterized conserved protein, contains S4-like domain
LGEQQSKFKKFLWESLVEETDKAVREVVLVDNLRVDKMIAVAFKISRNIATNMLESKKVKVNYLEIDKKDFSVGLDDLISVRGFGRIKILRILDFTKKENRELK